MSPDQPTATRWAKARSVLFNAALILGVFVAVTSYQSRNMLSADSEPSPGLRGVTLAAGVDNVGDADYAIHPVTELGQPGRTFKVSGAVKF